MADGSSFLKGMMLGATVGVVWIGINASSFAQTVDLQGPAAEISRSNSEGEQAIITGGDWGALHVQARDGQRITASLSLAEVTRVDFIDDVVVGVRAAQNGRADAPLIEFEQDTTTGDLYIVVAQGSANQVISAFATTQSGQTYHFLFTIREQPATQIFVQGLDLGLRPVGLHGEGRADAREAQIVEFAHRAMNATELAPPRDGDRPLVLRENVRLLRVGDVAAGGMRARVYDIDNRSDASVPVVHDAFMAQGVIAVVSLLDEVPPGSRARLAVVEMEGRENGGR